MANQEKMVTVDLNHSVGLRSAAGGGTVMYGPGKGVKVPERLARGLGLTAKELEEGGGLLGAGEQERIRNATGGEGGNGGGGQDFDAMTVADLEAHLASKNIQAAELKGSGSGDSVVKADLVKAAKAVEAGKEPKFTPEARKARKEAAEAAERDAAAARGAAPGNAPAGEGEGANTGSGEGGQGTNGGGE